jgi:hypothetical protein
MRTFKWNLLLRLSSNLEIEAVGSSEVLESIKFYDVTFQKIIF